MKAQLNKELIITFLRLEQTNKISWSSKIKLHSGVYASIYVCRYEFCLVACFPLLPARASEQGNVIGSVRIYIYMCVCTKKNCN